MELIKGINMTRKLATLQCIKEILPIEGADRIEICVINGWQVVSQKGHKVGDMVVYFEIDSFLPATDPRYESFSERFTNWGDKRGMRVRTIKLRRTLSQGVIMPLHEFPEVKNTDYTEGTDVSELLGIEKWEPLEKENTCTKGNPGRKFPSFIHKTDQERIQNYGSLVERALDEEFEATMKKDGSSLTVFRVDSTSPYYSIASNLFAKKLSFWGKILRKAKEFFNLSKDPIFGICSRNLLMPIKGDTNFHKAAYGYDLLTKLERMGGSYALQGEVLAPNIQNNHERVSKVEFHLFDIFNIDRQKYLLPMERTLISEKLGINHVTRLGFGTLRKLLRLEEEGDVVKAALKFSEGPGDNPGVIREGVVFKSLTRDFSFKAVSNAYLLKTGN